MSRCLTLRSVLLPSLVPVRERRTPNPATTTRVCRHSIRSGRRSRPDTKRQSAQPSWTPKPQRDGVSRSSTRRATRRQPNDWRPSANRCARTTTKPVRTFSVAERRNRLVRRRFLTVRPPADPIGSVLAAGRPARDRPGQSIPMVQLAVSDRVAENERRRLIADEAGAGADGAVLRHLAEEGPASAAELRAALPGLARSSDPAPGKPWGDEVTIAPRVLTVLPARGDIVAGPRRGPDGPPPPAGSPCHQS